MAWMSWEKMGRTREKGGLGFRDFENFNLALLTKQGWRLLHNTESLVAKIYKEKYYPNGTFWKLLLEGLLLMHGGVYGMLENY